MCEKNILFGGSFDPPTITHQAILNTAIQCIDPDLVFVLPCWKREGKSFHASYEHRVEMCRIAFGKTFYVKSHYCNIDTRCEQLKSPYTYDFVRSFRENYPNEELYLLCGTDLIPEIPSWYKVKDYIDDIIFLFACQEGTENTNFLSSKPFKRSMIIGSFSSNDIHSSDIRRNIHNMHSSLYIDKNVLHYIDTRDLYKEE